MNSDFIDGPKPIAIEGYETLKELGAGSLTVAFLCRDIRHEKCIVVKAFWPDLLENTALDHIFSRLETFKTVTHPNVLTIYDFFRTPKSAGYSLEYADAGSLENRVGIQGSIRETISILKQIAFGLQAIHDAGFVHRNIKPGKIFLTSSGVAKLGESSVAIRSRNGPVTNEVAVAGTVEYVPPEYLLSSEVTSLGDIYCLGVLAYELIAGVSPYRGDTVYEKMQARMQSDPIPPHELNSNCSRALSDSITKAMKRDPSQRYQKAVEFAEDLIE